MKTFIFATDFSQNAQNALAYAAPIVEKLEGRLLLFHAFDHANPYVEVPAYVMEELDEEIKQNATANMRTCMSMVHELTPTLPCEYTLRKGSLLKTLMDVIDEENAEAVLMGTQGATGIKKVMMGSNTAKVIGKVQCPVLAIPEGCKYTGMKRVVYATDFQSDHAFILEQLRTLAETFNSAIDILHVATENQKIDIDVYDWYQDAVKMILPEDNVNFKVVKNESVQAGISGYVKDEQPDLVIMAMNQKDWIDRLLKGSNTKRQVYHTQKPLLVFHAKVEEKVKA